MRERLKEATATAILQAAEEVFAERGLHAAKMEEVAAKAGVSVGTLYNHFKDRTELLTSLLETRQHELVERVDRALTEGEGKPFEAQLRGYMLALGEHLEAHHAFLSILIQGEHDKGAAGISKPRWAMEQLYARMETLVGRGLQSGALRPEDADIYSTMLMGVMRGAMVRRLYYEASGELPLGERVDKMVRFFMRGAGR